MPSAKKRSKQSSSSKPTTRQSARKKRNQSPDPSTDGEQSDTSRDDSKENSDEDNDKHPDKDEDSNINLKNAVLPTLANYATVGVEWTDTYLDKVLARRKIGSNNRPSQDILLEAQALQDTFEQSLKMLSLAGHVSYPTLRAALFLGPSQRATTAYDTYRAYSKKNTQETAMPPRNTRPGFAPRNKAIGNVWTSLDTLQKAIFHPPFFKRLAEAVLQPDSVQSSIPATEDSLNPSDLTSYIPTFRELVNMRKVERHFERGSLGIPQSVQSEKKGRDKVGKVVKQLHALHAQFQIEFHLLVSSFTPKTKLAKALWMEEYTSCDRWAQLVKSEHHLLENFAKRVHSISIKIQCPFRLTGKLDETTNTWELHHVRIGHNHGPADTEAKQMSVAVPIVPNIVYTQEIDSRAKIESRATRILQLSPRRQDIILQELDKLINQHSTIHSVTSPPKVNEADSNEDEVALALGFSKDLDKSATDKHVGFCLQQQSTQDDSPDLERSL
ncbi:uncharacterized protein MELLADRAFT_113400 [Melampsora larici-populina 98AG31]|uniref:Uncharacterized protein n=1 Tax=Melampsora larici-populina (strain 98AG31 / pathotype 3-4-7) TaxID=747676 RepID=F4S9R2_MELLP|nr:uncharacterized protein MELLADRAFT_113400 [Melampsora larici-populina 98AG31]EGF98619.1 hypothetical protein MELLADRAFT_113400 [Melampsora larici-populina 98AG31]